MPITFEPSSCIRCGACKAPCPTFDLDFDETMTARGRLRLIMAVEEGRLEPSRSLRRRISTCVHCGSCETRCPVGLDIMEIIYRGRERLMGKGRLSRFLSSRLLSPSAADDTMRWLGALQRPFARALERSRRFRHLPPMPETPFRTDNQVFKPTRRPRGRVAFFVGCATNYLYPEVGDDLVAVLLHLDYEVVAIRGEVCCGAPHRELGHTELALQLARKNLEIFGKIQAEAIVTACPTCALTLRRQYPHLLPETAPLAEKVRDINEFLLPKLDRELGNAGLGDAVYHDPCHLVHGLSVTGEPRKLLEAAGCNVVPFARGSSCCGFGGIFGLTHYDLSKRIGAQRREDVESTGARNLVTACPGCMLQFQDALKGTGKKVWHTVEVLRKAIQMGEIRDVPD